MDLEFIAKYIPLYQKAAVLTVEIGILGIAVAILIGLVRYIIFPQAVSISAPAFIANIIFLLSDRADSGALEE